jgi:glycosyltransferase involved in cell wall biosynthesis
MAVYNGQPWLGEAVESVLKQSLKDWEFIIINDGSTDGSLAVLEEYAAQDSRIRLCSTPNQGLTLALNAALDLSRGSYIARQDADDRSHVTRLERQADFLDRHLDIVLVGSGAKLLGAARTPFKVALQPARDEDIAHKMRKQNAFFHSSVMMRGAAVRGVQGYDPRFIRAQDYELWLRLMDLGRAANLSEALIDLYQGEGRISRRSARAQVTAALRAKLKNRKGRVLKGTPPHTLLWQMRGYLVPPGTLDQWRARRQR